MLLITDSAEQVLLTAHKQPHRIADCSQSKNDSFWLIWWCCFSLLKEDQESQKTVSLKNVWCDLLIEALFGADLRQEKPPVGLKWWHLPEIF